MSPGFGVPRPEFAIWSACDADAVPGIGREGGAVRDADAVPGIGREGGAVRDADAVPGIGREGGAVGDADAVPGIGREGGAVGDADAVPGIGREGGAVRDADAVPGIGREGGAVRDADAVPGIGREGGAVGKQHRIGGQQHMPTISRTYTLHYVPGEGRREQGENRDKRELAVKEFAHLNTTPWLKKDLTPSGSKTGQAQRVWSVLPY